MPDFIPQSEALLASWTRIFTRRIVSDPARFEISVAQVLELQARQEAFDLAFAVAVKPDTRTVVSVANRDECKSALLATVRRIAWTVRKTPDVKSDELLALGLRPLNDHLSPIRAPADPPSLLAWTIGSHLLRVTLRASAASRRPAKPAGVASAAIFIALSEAGVTHASEWAYHSTQTRAAFDMTIKKTLPYGQSVWVCARWLNPRGEPGPASAPRHVRLAGGVLMAMAQLAA